MPGLENPNFEETEYPAIWIQLEPIDPTPLVDAAAVTAVNGINVATSAKTSSFEAGYDEPVHRPTSNEQLSLDRIIPRYTKRPRLVEKQHRRLRQNVIHRNANGRTTKRFN